MIDRVFHALTKLIIRAGRGIFFAPVLTIGGARHWTNDANCF